MNLRLKRLANDARELKRFLKGHPRISLLNAAGDPPEKYQIEYRIKGLEKKGDEIVTRDKHAAEIFLPLDYPAIEPKCRMLTPVFHPNISPQVICHTDNWAAGESLVDVVLRIGEMISYQNYNIKSPRNGEAARWAETNAQRFPIDPVDLSVIRPAEDADAPEEPDIAAEPESLPEIPAEPEKELAPKEAAREIFACANCGAKRESLPFPKCSHGHSACPDCLILCEACGKSLCVLCPLARCPICRKIICGDCSKICPACGRTLCRGHVHGPEGLCSECSASFQAPTGSSSPEPAQPEARPEVRPEPRPVSGKKCTGCGRIVARADALFCEFCGTRLV